MISEVKLSYGIRRPTKWASPPFGLSGMVRGGKNRFIKKLGITYSEIEKMGVMLPLTEVTCKYYKGTRYEDELTVTARVLSVSPSRMTFGYQVFLPGEKRPVSEGTTSHGFVDSGTFRAMNLKKRFPKLYQDLFDSIEPRDAGG